MKKVVLDFIRDKQVNSFTKLRFLLFLTQHPQWDGSPQQLAERLYIELPLAERVTKDLEAVGLLEGKTTRDNYSLHHEPHAKACLEELARLFEDPLGRQELLAQMKKIPSSPRLTSVFASSPNYTCA